MNYRKLGKKLGGNKKKIHRKLTEMEGEGFYLKKK